MFKFCVLIALAVAAANAQEAPVGEAAAEPYSYGYETESHAAAEQRSPDGKVTGYYTLADADGRQRRVEYFADETGFHAKVQTNEVGTKSENSADVEVLAAPPTREQLIYQAPAPQQQVYTQTVAPQPQRIVTQQVVASPQRYQYVQQPAQYGYTGYTTGYTGAGYNTGYYPAGYYGASGQYVSSTARPVVYGAGYNGVYGNYNNHLPSQYYRSLTTTSQPATYGVSGSRYVSTVGVPQTTYQTVPAGYSTVQGSSNAGSSNYIVLKKRDAQK